MFSTTRLIALASLALAVSAAPSPAADAVATTCYNAYNFNNPSKPGTGMVYTCSKVSNVCSPSLAHSAPLTGIQAITSYICYIGETGPKYCCSGYILSTPVSIFFVVHSKVPKTLMYRLAARLVDATLFEEDNCLEGFCEFVHTVRALCSCKYRGPFGN